MATLGSNVQIGVHEGKVVRLRHEHQPFKPPLPTDSLTPEKSAAAYLKVILTEYPLGSYAIAPGTLTTSSAPGLFANRNELRLARTKSLAGNHLVTYRQFYLGIPVWKAGIAMQIETTTKAVVSAQSTLQDIVPVGLPADLVNGDGSRSMDASLPNAVGARQAALNALRQIAGRTSARVVSADFVGRHLYRYHPADSGYETGLRPGARYRLPELQPDPVSSFKEGDCLLVNEFLVTLHHVGWGNIVWRLFFEHSTFEVVYQRHFISLAQDVDAKVFRTDPVRLGVTDQYGAPLTPVSDATILKNECRSDVKLPMLEEVAGKMILKGRYIVVENHPAATPNAAIPSEYPGIAFNYDPTGGPDPGGDAAKFAAVNAYYHLDSLYRMVIEEFGFTDYFAGSFGDPAYRIRVDHRAEDSGTHAAHGGEPNPANGAYRTAWYLFGLMHSANKLGRAADRACVIHEFGHSCLYHQTGDGELRRNDPGVLPGDQAVWCHGIGDALAVILLDPDNQAPDHLYFKRSPLMTGPGILAATAASREHNKPPELNNSFHRAKGANGSSVLATILFRAYRANGGGQGVAGDYQTGLEQREYAARYLAHRIIGAIGGCAGTLVPITSHLELLDLLIAFDKCSDDHAGNAGGGFHKVLEWEFQEQGLSTEVGFSWHYEDVLPDVDVYIDDGRNGEYEWQENFWSSTDIWNRLNADGDQPGGDFHQPPVVGTTNYLYVRVRNRGTNPATSVKVRAFHCKPSAGLRWPDDWQPLTTPELDAPNDVPANSTGLTDGVIVGPFDWTPAVAGHECLLAIVSAAEDAANVSDANGATDTITKPIPHWRLVPFDNNIAQRNVSPVVVSPYGSGSGSGLASLLLPSISDSLANAVANLVFWVNNPYNRKVTAVIDVKLPKFLEFAGWSVSLQGIGGARLKLDALQSRKIAFTLVRGNDVPITAIPPRGDDLTFRTLIDGIIVGGITYHFERGRFIRLHHAVVPWLTDAWRRFVPRRP